MLDEDFLTEITETEPTPGSNSLLTVHVFTAEQF